MPGHLERLTGLEKAFETRQHRRPAARHGLDQFRFGAAYLMDHDKFHDITGRLYLERTARMPFRRRTVVRM
jgi:hypothetical protein